MAHKTILLITYILIISVITQIRLLYETSHLELLSQSSLIFFIFTVSRFDTNNVYKTIQPMTYILIASVLAQMRCLHETYHLGLHYHNVLHFYSISRFDTHNVYKTIQHMTYILIISVLTQMRYSSDSTSSPSLSNIFFVFTGFQCLIYI